MREILKTDIMGARIVEIHETFEITEGGLDCRQIYFTTDRGFTFVTPFAGVRWTEVALPPNATLLPDEVVSDEFAVSKGWFGLSRFTRLPSTRTEVVRQIKQRLIAGVYCGPFDVNLGFHYPTDGTIVFSDGAQLSNNVVAPHGTGGAGLYFALAGSDQATPAECMVDFFTIPVTDEPA
ncbi:MAG TPA: hypothetical protein VHO24_01095 [Opitutaceae bacterium]|nr:hypothetical protein [Opitutaceae bacterium]